MNIPSSAVIPLIELLKATPGNHVLLRPDGQGYRIEAVSAGFLSLIGGVATDVIGRDLLTVRPVALYNEVTVAELRKSFSKVLENQLTEELSIQQGNRELNMTNTPVMVENRRAGAILHSLTVVVPALPSTEAGSLSGIRNAYKFFMDAPVIIGYLKGDDYVIEMANQGLLEVWQRTADVIGKPLLVALPELRVQGIKPLLDNVRATGEPFFAYSYPLLITRNGRAETLYFDFVYQPFYEDNELVASGIISVGHDVTAQVVAKQKTEESRQKWELLANAIPALVWASEANGHVYFLNKQWFEFTGLTEEESRGFGWTAALHPDDVDRCLDVWEKARNNATLYEIELRYRNRDGHFRWMIVRGVPVSINGQVTAWYGTCTDIDDRKQLEHHLEEKVTERAAELEEKNKLLDNLLSHSSNGITISEMIFDEHGRVVDALTIMANDAAVTFAGIPRELYLSKKATEMDPNIMESAYGKACLETLQTGRPTVMQYFLEFSGKWLELTVSKMDDCRLIHIFTDITPIKKGQLELERSLEELQYANANLEQFAYAASHDLKEPVRKIHLFSNRLKEELSDVLTEKQVDLFQRLENSSMRMDKLITDLLEYSQAAQGLASFDRIDLGQTVQAVLEDLELEIQSKGARISADVLPSIQGNKRQIHQLFQNLIGNALKYSRRGAEPMIMINATVKSGRELPVVPGHRADQLFHLIEVIDNGIGFEQKDASVIFNIFTRLNSGSEYRGSGVGLSIVRKVVESHLGYVWAESQPGKGSSFKVLLPCGE